MNREQFERFMKCFMVVFVDRVMEIKEEGTSYEAIESKKGTITVTCRTIQLTEEDLKAIAIECLMEVLKE